MTSPHRLVYTSLLMAAILVIGMAGFHVIEGQGWWDSFYMTVITLTTVGFEEVFPLSTAGQIFTTVLLFVGLGLFLFLATDVARTIIEGEIRTVLGRVRRSRMIDRLSGHHVVCGFGRMGRAVVDELRRRHLDFVVVDRNGERVRDMQAEGIAAIQGDATSEETLREAHIDSARGMVSCVNDDAHNVYAVLTARGLNPNLFIVARATEEGAERRLVQAGADRVVNPYHLGGTRLAHLVIKPAIVSFFDASLDSTEELQIDQASLRADSPIANQTLSEANVRRRWGLGVIAVQRAKEAIAIPPADFQLQAGDVLVVFGTRQQIEAFERDCGGG